MWECESERGTFEHRHENKSCSACQKRVNESVKVLRDFLVPSFCLTLRHFFKFDDKDLEKSYRAITWFNNIDEFLKYNAILEEKKWEDQKNVVVIYFGKGSTKVVLTLHDEDEMNVIDDEITTSDKDSKNTQRHLVKESKILAIVRCSRISL